MKYSNYIHLSPTYESVVSMETDANNPMMWQEYVVQDDMLRTVEAVCQTMEYEDEDKRRSFWIQGVYGTGKSYAAIVLKHLFTDRLEAIDPFLSKPALVGKKKRFVKIREKGDFLVVWTSGVTAVRSGTHLMLEMEVKICAALKEKYGDRAYYGKSSLIKAAKDAIIDPSINWQHFFDNNLYGVADTHETFEEFKEAVLDENLNAVYLVKSYCDDIKRSMFTGIVELFEEWLKDIIEGNRLTETGIIFFWDEFTAFLRDCGDDNVLQRLSELCKSKDRDGNMKLNAPFFMFLIVHKDPTHLGNIGDRVYERILHRYHNLEYHITENAAYDLIGESIQIRAGFENDWNKVKEDLINSLGSYIGEFDALEQSVNMRERLMKLSPIHPMTLTLLATVAQNFGASQRTLFRFMKDETEKLEGVGFKHYIENYGPSGWEWLTPDFLWDYFFLRRSDNQGIDSDARKVIINYQKHEESISGSGLHVFKAAMLLIAVMSGSYVTNIYSKQNRKTGRLGANRNTLYKCFRGQLPQSTIDEYITSFQELDFISLAELQNGDARMELPFTGSADAIDLHLEKTKKDYTRYKLFAKKGAFSDAIEKAIWTETSATHKRMYIAACSQEKTSIDARLGEVKDEIRKHPYKIGLLVVVVAEAADYSKFQDDIKELAAKDESKRLVIAMLREPCKQSIIDAWHRSIARRDMCAEAGATGDMNKAQTEADVAVATWTGPAVDSQIYACYGKTQFTGVYGKRDLQGRIENDVIWDVFKAAPERIVKSHTAFNRGNTNAVLYGLSKKGGNNQVFNVSTALMTAGAWDMDDLESLKNLNSIEPVSVLAALFQEEFLQGAKVSLSILWEKLQHAPFGYYNSMAAGCFIGLALRSILKDGSFNWIDGTNPHLPTEANYASMVISMMEGKAINGYLSSGSAIWQQFKVYAQKLFGLTQLEVANDVDARKFIKQATTSKIGTPFWVLKYLPSDSFGSEDFKEAATQIVDLLCEFVYETNSDQESVMNDVITKFNGRGKLREAMSAAYTDRQLMLRAFKLYLFKTAPELEAIYAGLNLTDRDVFDALKVYLQDSLPTWQEAQVSEKLPVLVQELSLISLLGNEMDIQAKTYKVIQNDLNKRFENMKISGKVVEQLPFSWIPALKLMREISKTSFAELSNCENILRTLRGNAKTAWEYLAQSNLLLEAVLNARNIVVDEDELRRILDGLTHQPYETPIAAFDAKLSGLLDNVQYKRDTDFVKKLWEDETGTPGISEWCNNISVPITWLFDDAGAAIIRTIKAVQEGRTVDKKNLGKALEFMRGHGVDVLKDTSHVMACFFSQIGENYRQAFITDKDKILGKLKTNRNLTPNVYTWENKQPEIRRTLDEHLQITHLDEAKKRVNSMPEDELRDTVLRMLDKNPELYSNFMG